MRYVCKVTIKEILSFFAEREDFFSTLYLQVKELRAVFTAQRYAFSAVLRQQLLYILENN